MYLRQKKISYSSSLSLEVRRKNHRLCFKTQILQNEDLHRTLSTACDEIARDKQLVTVTIRAAARGKLISIYLHQEEYLSHKFPATNLDYS